MIDERKNIQTTPSTPTASAVGPIVLIALYHIAVKFRYKTI